jgi:hypothetical protein
MVAPAGCVGSPPAASCALQGRGASFRRRISQAPRQRAVRALAASSRTNGGAAEGVGPDPHDTCPAGGKAAGFGTARHNFGMKSSLGRRSDGGGGGSGRSSTGGRRLRGAGVRPPSAGSWREAGPPEGAGAAHEFFFLTTSAQEVVRGAAQEEGMRRTSGRVVGIRLRDEMTRGSRSDRKSSFKESYKITKSSIYTKG